MDDICVNHKDLQKLKEATKTIIRQLEKNGLNIAQEKIQTIPPSAFLGAFLTPTQVFIQRPHPKLPDQCTLNELQTILGETN
jgi:hypothetical protein